MLGVEAVDNILHGTKEFTLFYPSLVSEGGERGRLVCRRLRVTPKVPNVTVVHAHTLSHQIPESLKLLWK